MMANPRKIAHRRAAAATLASLLGACALSMTPARAEEAFDLEALVKAAKAEKPINIYDSTGKIVEMADNFSKKLAVSMASGEAVGPGRVVPGAAAADVGGGRRLDRRARRLGAAPRLPGLGPDQRPGPPRDLLTRPSAQTAPFRACRAGIPC